MRRIPRLSRWLFPALIVMAQLAIPAQAGSDLQLGLRPLLLIKDLDPGPLRDSLESCANKPMLPSDFSIAHRGAPLMIPEHTREGYEAAVRMGAGMVECDATFTRDKVLVCRHSQCDLHNTTNILETELASTCREPFQPAVLDSTGNLVRPASAQCCTSDLTAAEFKSLRGKRDGFNPRASTASEYVQLAGQATGTLLTHRESIALFKELGVKMVPELKAPMVPMPFEGMTQAEYAQALIDDYRALDVPPEQVWPQSFSLQDLHYWLEQEPAFGRQAVYLDGRDSNPDFNHRDPATWSPSMEELKAEGIRNLAPPLWMLVETKDGEIIPSVYARAAKAAELALIPWTLERSGRLQDGGDWYYQTLNGQMPLTPGTPGIIDKESDVLRLLHVLARDLGVKGVFSDWPATVTYYANCLEPTSD